MDKNTKLALRLFLLVAVMIGASFAAVPAYDLFCKMTGFGGTTGVAPALPPTEAIKDRELTISFNANVHRDLPWDFKITTPTVRVKLGDAARATFKVKNNSDQAITGVATYNVTPLKAGAYFQKVVCFCFSEHVLQPGEEQEFPILFFIDPSFDDDINLRDITTLSLSYTYFHAKDAPKP